MFDADLIESAGEELLQCNRKKHFLQERAEEKKRVCEWAGG